MSIIDFKSSIQTEFEADICIVGSGPAGIAVAMQFMDSALKVIVLESGGLSSDAETQALSEIESVGMARAPQAVTRSRGFGGTSALWSGRCGVFDAMDFEARSWVPHSGWPIGPEDLAPYWDRAGQVLGLGPALYQEQQAQGLMRKDKKAWDPLKLRPVVWQYSQHDRNGPINHFAREGVEGAKNIGMLQHSGAPRSRNVGEYLQEALASSPNLDVLLNANATEVLAGVEGKRVEAVRIASLSGRVGLVRAKTVVLACGAIDNARLMLCSRGSSVDGIGNAHGNVGRYLSDHPFWPIGHYDGAGSKVARRLLGTRWLTRHGEKHVYVLGLRMSSEMQRQERLLNSALHIVEFGHEPPPVSHLGEALRKLKRRDLGKPTWLAFYKAARHPRQLVSGIYARYVDRQPPLAIPSSVSFGAVVEQVPDPESRVTLSQERDALGMPRARVDWRVSTREFDNARRLAEVTADELERMGLEKPRFADWLNDPSEAFRQHIHDMAHPMSTTRMSADPADGVVDANCKVHGVEGLYVAGSSVFSTSGYMNPTLMVVALSLRLADHLKSLAKARVPASAMTQNISKAEGPVRIGFVGAGHRIKSVYWPVVEQLSDRFEIAGVSSRSIKSAEAMASTFGAEAFDNVEGLVQKARPDILVVAVEGIDDVLPGLLHLGIPLFIETPFCWNLRKGRKALATIRKHSVLVGIAEQFPQLPAEQLKRKVIDLGLIGKVFTAHNDFGAWDYHGLAVVRRYLAGAQGAGIVNAVSHLQAALAEGPNEDWLNGSVRYRNGGLLQHSFSGAYHGSSFREPKQFRAYGTSGSIVGDTMLFGEAGEAGMRSAIRRDLVDGRLQSVSVETPNGPVRWDNPFAHARLDDEQIAVATMLEQMSLAARFGGVASYSAQESFDDMELLAAMRASARRNGAPITLPLNPVWESAEKILARFNRGKS